MTTDLTICGTLVYMRIIPRFLPSFVAKYIKAHNGKFIQYSTEYASQVYHLCESAYVYVLVTHMHMTPDHAATVAMYITS